jgi:hypothetical protein
MEPGFCLTPYQLCGKDFHLPSEDTFVSLPFLRGFGGSARRILSSVLMSAERTTRYTMAVYSDKSAKL